MRHLHTGRKLGTTPHHRLSILRSLTLALIEKETIRTTPAKAKEIRWWAERIVTLAKRGDVHSRRQIIKLLGTTQTQVPGKNRTLTAVDKVYSALVPRFKTRPGGYTQIVRLAERRPGDNAEMCIMRYIPAVEDTKGGKGKKKPAQDKPAKQAKADTAPKKEAKAQDKEAKAQDKDAKAAKPQAKKKEDKEKA